MTDKSRFIDWLIKNHKLDVYISMVKIWHNRGSIEGNRVTAMEGILELEKQFMVMGIKSTT